MGTDQAADAASPAPRVVIYSNALSVDSHGYCMKIHAAGSHKTKYLVVGEYRCHECRQCAKPPLLHDAIQIVQAGVETEIKSHDLYVTEEAKRYGLDHGVHLTKLPAD
ncbi:hypothetical protein MoryE10_27730 [Methylogaea oryzae]|uniref:Uncharacterized protein n=2 Tax=Methylogaea oryzae TaxID=1295382 RepID=A0A8D4VRY4_9GAMM|nr:hypothetical protein MoryE10_27730 [Methylogaea oryzae]